MEKSQVFEIIKSQKTDLANLSDAIWEYAETAFTEFKSAELLCSTLEKEGFTVTREVADIKTAFSASFGSGNPIIGILGEFDALSNLSQVANTTEKSAIVKGAAGHGCGHHLLGVGSLAAAVAVKKYLEETNKSGTVIYYGCPGEEGGSGKAFMARDGVFDNLDIAFCWHPSDTNGIMAGSSLANIQVSYKFKGVAAHAAACPHLGRSALDAVELMNVGVNFLREHIIPEARVHYAITNTGGYSPNVVQPEAEVLYLIRAPKNDGAQEIYNRINKIAQGAALMTETELEVDFVKACSNIITNTTLEKLMFKNLQEVPCPTFEKSNLQYAKDIQSTIENFSSTIKTLAEHTADFQEKELLLKHQDNDILDFVLPYQPTEVAMPGSTDVGDVSWVCPTAQINTACYAANTPGHSWQLVAQGKCETAYLGMEYAAEVLAASAIDILNNPDLIEVAKNEHKLKVGDGYKCPIPNGVKPRAIGSKM